jgi:pyridoxal 5'-phosphate synthase pdxT subunit
MRRVGVLALQGDFEAHKAAIERAGGLAFEARTREDIDAAEALVLPGGESTVMGNLLVRFGLLDGLIRRIGSGLPVFGTCAGLILLAKTIEAGKDQPGIRLLDVTVRRNAFGRQIDSFRAAITTSVPGAAEMEAVFIRAPRISAVGPGVTVLASYRDEPVLVRQGNILAATFHPELTENQAIQRFFLSM